MDPIDADRYEQNFTAAVRQQRTALDAYRAMGDRDQDTLAEIETDLERLAATARGRDLDFWQGEQASQLFADLDDISQRIVRESRQELENDQRQLQQEFQGSQPLNQEEADPEETQEIQQQKQLQDELSNDSLNRHLNRGHEHRAQSLLGR